MSQFSTNESISLEKRIDLQSNICKTNLDDIDQVYEIEKCTKFIQDHSYLKVCLQFPDYLLPDSAEILHRLEESLGQKVYILGDTAYESCCIDFTAAKHISADCIIHFGNVCFSKPEIDIIPHLKIYEKFELNVDEFCRLIKDKFESNAVLLLIDTGYLHKIDELQFKLKQIEICSVENININLNTKVLYLGQNDRKLMNIYLNYNLEDLYYFDPKSSKNILNYVQDTKILKRRYYLTEKIKDSATLGIVISTLAVQNYLKIIERIITLIKLHEKKYYLISVGKPNIAKLANFPEIDIFVVVGCSMNEIYDNRDFYKPIVTPFDLEAALNSNQNSFTYDFNKILINDVDETAVVNSNKSDVSLVTGQIRFRQQVEDDTEGDNKIAVRQDGKLVTTGFLANRSWQGLEQDLGKTDVKLATKGRIGIALNYENETN